jgi:endonuclease YncB( thermonuclease family)
LQPRLLLGNETVNTLQKLITVAVAVLALSGFAAPLASAGILSQVDATGEVAAQSRTAINLALAVEPRAHAADLDCADFSSQGAAQNYFLSLGGPGHDPDRLDGDSDGQACESLPCPCGASAGGAPRPSPRARKVAQVIQARITKVTDGDTVKVRAFGARRSHYTVRLIGIDTPEKYFGTECGSAGASADMRKLALERNGGGRRVVLTTDPTQATFDRYGRLLAYVRTTSGNQLNVAQVARGWAEVYVYGGRPFQQVARFRAAERRARSAHRGVWGRCGGDFHKAA